METAVNRMIENSAVPGTYGESAAIWENDIKGLCTMIQDYIMEPSRISPFSNLDASIRPIITRYMEYSMSSLNFMLYSLQVNQSVRGFMAMLVSVLTAGLVLSTMITKSVTTPINSLRQTLLLRHGDIIVSAGKDSAEEVA